jgi:hypothetical protein
MLPAIKNKPLCILESSASGAAAIEPALVEPRMLKALDLVR